MRWLLPPFPPPDLVLSMLPRLSFPLGTVPVPLIRQGRVSGIRAAKRHSQQRARHV